MNILEQLTNLYDGPVNEKQIALRTSASAVWTVTRLTQYKGKPAVEEINVVGYANLHKVLAVLFNFYYVPTIYPEGYAEAFRILRIFTAEVQVKYFGQVQ